MLSKVGSASDFATFLRAALPDPFAASPDIAGIEEQDTALF
jgi:hypothetical protein